MKSRSSMVIAIAAVVVLALTLSGVARADDVEDLLRNAQSASKRNLSAIRDYECDLKSYRTAWHMDGKPDRDNYLEKKLYVRLPDKKKEVFIKGTMNGEPAEKNDFIWEKFGLDNQTMFHEIEALNPAARDKFEYHDGGTELLNGALVRVLEFRSLDPEKTELQHGKAFLDPQTFTVLRLEGTMVHRLIQRNEVDFSVDFLMVDRAYWLPERMVIDGVMSMVFMKRKTHALTTFENYKVNIGLGDEVFD